MVTNINASTSSPAPNYDLLPTRDSLAADFGGDAAAELAAMLFMFSRERSKDAAENRDALESAVQARQAQQVDLMHEQAEARFTGAVIQGVTQVAAGLVSLSGGSGDAQATSQYITGCGTIGAGNFNKQADNLGADALAQGHQADTGIRALEQVEQNATEAHDMRKRTFDVMSAIQESKAEADKALVSIRV